MKEPAPVAANCHPSDIYWDGFAQSLEQSERSPNTLKNYLYDLKAFVKWFENERSEELIPAKITPTDLREYRVLQYRFIFIFVT